jgi:hypothetical protein
VKQILVSSMRGTIQITKGDPGALCCFRHELEADHILRIQSNWVIGSILQNEPSMGLAIRGIMVGYHVAFLPLFFFLRDQLLFPGTFGVSGTALLMESGP